MSCRSRRLRRLAHSAVVMSATSRAFTPALASSDSAGPCHYTVTDKRLTGNVLAEQLSTFCATWTLILPVAADDSRASNEARAGRGCWEGWRETPCIRRSRAGQGQRRPAAAAISPQRRRKALAPLHPPAPRHRGRPRRSAARHRLLLFLQGRLFRAYDLPRARSTPACSPRRWCSPVLPRPSSSRPSRFFHR